MIRKSFALFDAALVRPALADAFRKDGTRITENLDFDSKAQKRGESI